MSEHVAIEKPLILGEKFEIYAGRYAVEPLYGNKHPLVQRFYQAMDRATGWQDLTLNALFVQAVLLDRPNEHERGQSAAAAYILGQYFALTIESSVFTQKKITTGLMNHDPRVEGPISASIPVLIAA